MNNQRPTTNDLRQSIKGGRELLVVSRKSGDGFTLLEMIISTGLFSVLVVSVISITLGVSSAQIKATNIQTIQDNIRFSLELITKEMRTGGNYQLSAWCAPPGSEISFSTSLGEPRTYFWDEAGKSIMRSTKSITGADCANAEKVAPLTSEEVMIDKLFFYLRGQSAGPVDGQPQTTIVLRVRSRSPKFLLESSMNLQTTVTQRLRDL